MKRSARYAAIVLGIMILTPPFSSDAGETQSPLRKKVIDFEGELVEGVNRKSFDSLSQISEAKKRKSKPHLYKKRSGFKSEIAETLKEMR
jgi:hypothetical protein